MDGKRMRFAMMLAAFIGSIGWPGWSSMVYYIDALNGDNSNAGTSWATAWKAFDFGVPTLTRGLNDLGSTYLYVGKDWQGAGLTDVGGFPASGSLIVNPGTASPITLNYTAISTGADGWGRAGAYRFELNAPLPAAVPTSSFVYQADSNAPFTAGGAVAGGYGFQPGDTIMVRGTFDVSAQSGSSRITFVNQLPTTGERVTYKSDAAGATLSSLAGSWHTTLGFVRAHSLAFEGLTIQRNRQDQSDGLIRADRENVESWRGSVRGAENILFQDNVFRNSRRLSWTTLPKADWIGNEFSEFGDGPGDLMAYPGYVVENNIFRDMTLSYAVGATMVRASGEAGNPGIVRNNTFYNLGQATANDDFATRAMNEHAIIENNIFMAIHGTAVDAPAGADVAYNLYHNVSVANWAGGTTGGTGNVFADPLFVDAAGKDFHLLSAQGYWDTATQSWNYSYSGPNSPAIDAGNPLSPFDLEPVSNGRINLGAYGNTLEASMSPEPGTLLLLGLAACGLILRRRRRS